MKKSLRIFSLILLLGVMGRTSFVGAQCTVLTTPVAGPVLQTSGGGTTRSSVAWNPNDSLYYSINAGSSNYPLETFGQYGGNSLFSTNSGFDYRGAWWNPLLNQLEGNGYSNTGLRQVDLSAFGYALNSGTVLFTGQNQPNAQSCGAFDYDNNEIIYYDNAVITKYDRTNNTFAGSVALNGTPVALSNLAKYSAMYTGCPGNEYALLDRINKRVYLYSKSTGLFSQSVQLPASCPVTNDYGAAYANDMIWVYDYSNDRWVSFRIFETCSVSASLTLSGPATICDGQSAMFSTSTQPGETYQWLLNGQAIPAATDSVFMATQSGNYQLLVSNGSCEDTSAVQSLTVLALPTASLAQSGVDSICDGDTLMLNLSSSTGTSLQWYNGSTQLAGQTSTSLMITQAGTYFVEVSDTAACASYSDSLTVAVNPSPNPILSISGNTLSVSATFSNYQWYLNGNAIAGATSNSYSASGSGQYYVSVTNSQGCEGSSNLLDLIVGTESQRVQEFQVYPNPGSDRFQLLLEGDYFGEIEVEVFDLQGRRVHSFVSDKTAFQFQSEIETETWVPGLYHLRLVAGETILIKKWVKD